MKRISYVTNHSESFDTGKTRLRKQPPVTRSCPATVSRLRRSACPAQARGRSTNTCLTRGPAARPLPWLVRIATFLLWVNINISVFQAEPCPTHCPKTLDAMEVRTRMIMKNLWRKSKKWITQTLERKCSTSDSGRWERLQLLSLLFLSLPPFWYSLKPGWIPKDKTWLWSRMFKSWF